MAKLSTRAALVTVAGADYMHIVDASDLTDGADGTSKKITITNLLSKANVGLANVDNTSDLTKYAAYDTRTATLTNKRITKRVTTEVSNTAPAINTDNVDMHVITALAGNITTFTMTGTPTNGQTLWLAITGTAARTITWPAIFESSAVLLPTTTVSTNRLDIAFVWNLATAKWRCIAAS